MNKRIEKKIIKQIVMATAIPRGEEYDEKSGGMILKIMVAKRVKGNHARWLWRQGVMRRYFDPRVRENFRSTRRYCFLPYKEDEGKYEGVKLIRR